MAHMQRTKEMKGGGWNPGDFRRPSLAELKVSTTHITTRDNLKLERYALITYSSKIKLLSDLVARVIDEHRDAIPEVEPAPKTDRYTVKFYNYPDYEVTLERRPRRDFVKAAIDLLIPDSLVEDIDGEPQI
jgi:hypothetical protein